MYSCAITTHGILQIHSMFMLYAIVENNLKPILAGYVLVGLLK